jgi:hypothetical protein
MAGLLGSVVCLPTPPAKADSTGARTWPVVSVLGQATTWKLSLLNLRKVDRIPGTQWRAYTSHEWAFWVLTLKMTNTGKKTAEIADDLGLTLKANAASLAKLGYTSPGWTAVDRKSKVLGGFIPAAAKAYGGVVPWVMTQPGKTTIYCYLIGARSQESHMGLFNSLPYKPQVFLFDTGM